MVLYDLMAKEDYQGDEILAHFGLGTEMLLRLTKNKEIEVDSKLNPDLDLSVFS